MMLASIVLPRPTSSARIARPPICRSTRWATSIWWGSSLIALASRVISRSKPGTSAMRSASRRRSYQARSVGGPFICSAKSFRDRSSTAQVSSGGAEGLGVAGGRWGVVTRWLDKSGTQYGSGAPRRATPPSWIPAMMMRSSLRYRIALLGSSAPPRASADARRGNETGGLMAAVELPLLGSNQDSPDPESGVLPVTPRGSVFYGAEGARTPDLLGAIQALSQLSYSPVRAGKLTIPNLFSKQLAQGRQPRHLIAQHL